MKLVMRGVDALWDMAAKAVLPDSVLRIDDLHMTRHGPWPSPSKGGPFRGHGPHGLDGPLRLLSEDGL